MQSIPQLIPAGLLVTFPLPVPVLLTVRVYRVVAVKVAVTVRAWDIVTWQVPAPLHDPLQPANFEPLAGVAVKVTTVPLA